MKVLKVVPMEYHSIESVRVFLFLGDFEGCVVLWLIGLVWLKCMEVYVWKMQFLRPGEIVISPGVLVICRTSSNQRAYVRQERVFVHETWYQRLDQIFQSLNSGKAPTRINRNFV